MTTTDERVYLSQVLDMDPLAVVQVAVTELEDALPRLTDACTDPQALDLAQLLYDVQAARIQLQGIERDLEAITAKALMGDQTEGNGLRVERVRSRDRKSWDHDQWRRDVRAKVLQAHGLRGVHVIDGNGEELPASVLYDALSAVQGVHGAGAPKVTALRDLGLSAEDYCETSPGVVHVKVQRLADETGA